MGGPIKKLILSKPNHLPSFPPLLADKIVKCNSVVADDNEWSSTLILNKHRQQM